MKKFKAPSSQEILKDLVTTLIEEEEFPKYMKKAFSIPKDIPLAKWSLANQFICFRNNCFDCRGKKQWEEVERHVKNGFQKAVFILGPRIIKIKDKDTKEEKEKLVGWRRIMVFPYESTEGQELPYLQKMKDQAELCSLPLVEIVKEMGVNLKVQPGVGYYGYFDRKSNEIALCTTDEQVFLHELSHSIDHKLGNSDNEDYAGGEIVAELSACFLASIYGKRADMAFTKQYLQKYIKDGKNKAQFAYTLFKYLDRVRAIYQFIKDSATHKTMSISRSNN